MPNASSPPRLADLPIRPWDYVRLRREAAGLTIAQAAAPFWTHPDHRGAVEETMASFECPGVTMQPHVAETLPRAFPFDPQVYRRLCDEPAERHPRLCRGCGWDQWTDATDLRGNDVRWHGDDDVCSRCVQIAERKALRRAA